MPPRIITAGILLFWLGMTGLLIEREVVPMMLADASPSYQIDLTDEIGSAMVGWNVFSDGQRIGTATSRIIANDDRSFDFHTKYLFDNFKFFGARFRAIESGFRVNEDGKLVAISARIRMGESARLQDNMTFELKGKVVDDFLQPRFYKDGVELKLVDLGKIDLSKQGSVVNPMHLMSRLRGLHSGQTWRINKLDPLSGMQSQVVHQIGKQAASLPVLIAEVKSDVLHWNQRDFDCYKIEYFEPGKEVTARTWVRKRDGLVLQQEASHIGLDMVTQRIPD